MFGGRNLPKLADRRPRNCGVFYILAMTGIGRDLPNATERPLHKVRKITYWNTLMSLPDPFRTTQVQAVISATRLAKVLSISVGALTRQRAMSYLQVP